MASREDQDMMASPWESLYSPVESPSQPQMGFGNINIANFVNTSSAPWVPGYSGSRTINTPLSPDQYTFHDYRNTHIPSDAGTYPSDSCFGGDVHRAPTLITAPSLVTAPSVQGEDQSLSPDAKRMEHLMGDVHLSPRRSSGATPTVDMQTGRPCFPCSVCTQTFDKKSVLNKHLRKHEKPFKCYVEGCRHGTKGFASSGDLRRHLHQVHKQPGNGKTYLCSFGECGLAQTRKPWPRSDNFRSHVHSKHKIKLTSDDDLSAYEYTEITTENILDGVGTGEAVVCRGEESSRCQQDGLLNTTTPLQEGTQASESGENTSHQSALMSTSSDLLPRDSDVTAMQAGYALAGRQHAVPIFFQEFDAPGTEGGKSPPLPFSAVAGGEGIHSISPIKALTVTHSTMQAGDGGLVTLGSSFPSQGPLPGPPAAVSSSIYTEISDTQQVFSSTSASFNETQVSPNTSLSFNAPSITSAKDDESTEPLKYQIPAALSVSGESSLPSYEKFNEAGVSPDGIADFLSEYPSNILELALKKRDARASKPTSTGANTTKSTASQVCRVCGKVCKRPCELRKHMKRHDRPYGCTVPDCGKRFGSKNDWKRHESTQHEDGFTDIWACDNSECRDCIFLNRADAEQHVSQYHGLLMSTSYIASKVEELRIGRAEDDRFWCGFCKDVIKLAGVSSSKQNNRKDTSNSSSRCDHIDDHLFGRNGLSCHRITEWVFLKAHCATRHCQGADGGMGGRQGQQPESRGRTTSDSTASKTKGLSSGSRGAQAKRKGASDPSANTRPAKRAGGSTPWRGS